VLLLWVCWRMYRELRLARAHAQQGRGPRKTLGEAMGQIILADLSMSLDNVLAVAGAAGESRWVLGTGLIFSVALMGAAANFLAHLLEKHRWIAWAGLLIVLYVAMAMIWHGAFEVAGAVSS
jgi:YjbE family integral membrane protein